MKCQSSILPSIFKNDLSSSILCNILSNIWIMWIIHFIGSSWSVRSLSTIGTNFSLLFGSNPLLEIWNQYIGYKIELTAEEQAHAYPGQRSDGMDGTNFIGSSNASPPMTNTNSIGKYCMKIVPLKITWHTVLVNM